MLEQASADAVPASEGDKATRHDNLLPLSFPGSLVHLARAIKKGAVAIHGHRQGQHAELAEKSVRRGRR
jgi:hypothetical protein